MALQESDKSDALTTDLTQTRKEAQSLRMRNLSIGIAGHLMVILFWTYTFYLGRWLIDLNWFLTLVFLGAGAQFVFIYIFWSGFNLRFKDPSMTLIQILVNITANLPSLYFMENEARGIFLFTYLYPFMFSILRLNYRTCFLIAGYSVATYLFLLYLIQLNRPGELDFSLELIRTGVFSGSMLWLAFFSGYTSQIRQKLRRGNQEIRQLLTRVEELAEHDELTGLYNRRKFWDVVRSEQERSKRTGAGLILCLADLDHFKLVNDRYGHQVGDCVLKRFAELAREGLRGYDMVARWGGEEFIFTLSGTSLQHGRNCMERIRKALEAEPFASDEGVFHVTLSIGIAAFRVEEQVDRTIARADEALYAAKKGGRNCIVLESALGHETKA